MKKLLIFLILNFTFVTLNSFCFAQEKNIRAKHSLTIDSLQALLKKDKCDTNKVIHLYQLTRECQLIGDFVKGLNFGTESLELGSKLNFKKGIAQANNNVGNIYLEQANYPKALDYYLKALRLDEEIKNKKGIAARLGNIGLVYNYQKDYSKALEYYFKGLKLAEELGNKGGLAASIGNIGNVYWNQINYPKALECYFKALKLTEEIGDKNRTALWLGNIGTVYGEQKNYNKTFEYFFKALKISKNLGDKAGTARHLGNIGSLYIRTGKFKEAEQYLKEAIALDDSIGAMDYLRQFEESISQLYDTSGRYKEALIHFKKSVAIKDTLFSQENKKHLVRKELNYEFDKKEAATKAANEKQQAVAAAEKHKQQFVLILVSCVLVLVFLFAGFIFRSLQITRKQKNIIELQKNEVSKQKEIVEKQKEKIVDSITYAQRIQQSILMEESEIQNYLPECFIYFQPKDIVSGDFYWCSKVDDKIIIAAVDCTGHGVPGAFMSMIGNTLLNQIVNEKHITKPSEILKLLNLGVYDALHQKKEEALSDDGMDIAICAIDTKNNEIQYAGAQNPLYVFYGNKIEIIKADIHGIGGGGLLAKLFDPVKIEYTNHIIKIKKDMSIYIFSDGYSDQFGDNERKKFGTPKFKELLLNLQHLSMQKQKENLVSAHAEWKGNTAQIDDILVIGIRI